MEDTNSVKKSGEELQDEVVNCNNQVISIKSELGRVMPSTPFLPEEIIIKIFHFLPGRVLHDVMSQVCRTWRKVIRDPDFTKSHLSQSSYISPIRVCRYCKTGFELYYLNKDDKTWNVKKKIIKKEYLADGAGLILTVDRDDRSILYLLNPITNQVVPIPHPPIKYSFSSKWAVGYSPLHSKYKLVYINYSSRLVYIWTVGVDENWRKVLGKPDIMTATVDVNNVDINYSPQWDRPLGICGLVCWYHSHNGYLIVLDLEEEIFYEVNSIGEFKGIKGYISKLIVKSDWTMCIAVKQIYWQFWELVDYKNGGEWRKLGSLDLESKSILTNRQRFINPIFIRGDEVTFSCNVSGRLFAYNFKSGVVSWSFEYEFPMELILTNSLLVL